MENTSLVGSENYAATVVTIKELSSLEGLDKLKALKVFGYQALVSADTEIGSRVVVFVAGSKLSTEFASKNNLFRKSHLNADESATGYLEENGRIKALKLRGHQSDALALPVSALGACDVADLKPFDTVGGVTICSKYTAPSQRTREPGKANHDKQRPAVLVSAEQFPEHYDTPQFARNRHKYAPEDHVVITQKLHGTSVRFGNVRVPRQLSLVEKVAKLFGAKVECTEYGFVAGSRRVTKSVNGKPKPGASYYADDIWSSAAGKYRETIPRGYMVYGEIIGWTGTGCEIQKGYTYDQAPGECDLYVYRVTLTNEAGNVAELSWDDVERFCERTGLKTVPVLMRTTFEHFERISWSFIDHVLCSQYGAALKLSNPRSVDEGVCVRSQSGVVTKHKSPIFLNHESKMMDADVADLEAEAAE